MDYLKLEESSQNSENGDVLAEKVTCFLEDDDIQCGHVVYNAHSRVLKFTCTYCQKTYDNIEYFCQHLSEHINTSPEQDEGPIDYKEQEEVDSNQEEFDNVEEYPVKLITNAGSFVGRKTLFEYSSTDFLHNTEDSNYTQNDFKEGSCGNDEAFEEPGNDSDVIIEEIEDVDYSRPDNAQDSRGTLGEGDNFPLLEDDSCSDDFIGYDNVDQKSYNYKCNISNHGNSFEECFLKETDIEKIRSEGVCVLKENTSQSKPKQKKRIKFQDMARLRRKRKKVTTVKVIAVKNRIAELYDRIMRQQAKSHQILASNGFLPQEHSVESSNMIFMEQETQDAAETYSTNDEDNNNDTSNELETKDFTRKIIGETLITLIPEATKLPQTLPTPVEKFDSIAEFSQFPKSENLNASNFNCTNNDKRAVCPACGKVFRSHFSLTIHKRIHYLESDSSVKLAHKCSDCDQLFNKLSQLKLHVESAHYPDGFICKICNRKLSSLSLLERHMIRVHLDRPFNCHECGKNFSDPLTFEEHIISHTSGEVYKCHICGRKYSTEFFLMEHMRNHKEQIPQTCVVCGKVTLRITQHMKIHTPRPKRLLSCSVCAKVFNFSSGLSHHFKIMHKLPRPPPKPKKESNPNIQKRKRKPRSSVKTSKKRNNQPNTLNDTSFNNTGDVIEEPSEIPDEVYDEDAHNLLNLTPSSMPQQRHHSINKDDGEGGNHESSLHHMMQHGHHQAAVGEEDVNHKEEEAKRVIVELIRSSTYTPLFPDNLTRVLEVTPPIAREETISAVNSIVHDC